MRTKTVEASFPSDVERTVASALLQLSSSRSKRESSCSPESFNSSGFSASKSGRSLIAEATVDEGSSRSQQLTVFAFVSGSEDLELKIVRKKRSKSICISNAKKSKPNKLEPNSTLASSESVSEITTDASVSSSLSSSSTAQSYSSETNAANKQRKSVMPGHMGHRAAAIMKVLSTGSATEVRIRQLLGDSPSTSKALRMLLRQQEVTRYGTGGRGDPYTYMIAY